jgi:tRNA threonylcarbamoyl adenosine modification protein YeaZ
MSVLALDTASRSSAWVILTNERGLVIGERELRGGELDLHLPGALADLIDRPLAAVVVLTGPGSYTGVRGGMAAALGLATSRGVPLHGIGNLTALAMAATAAPDGVTLNAVADAGRGGVYVARFVRRGSRVAQVSGLQRLAAGEVDLADPVFSTTEIPGLAAEVIAPATVLAGVVPRALETAPLGAAGLAAIHAEAGSG